jgi:energy-coupling factor transporter ATP-binding protein EcfA2
MSKDVSEDMLSKRVAYIIEIMGLAGCCDVVIHQAGTKASISGGQRRRISIALALLKLPSVLILDEPTSGLDSQSSLEVMQVLSKLAKQGYTILVTIHQPRQEIFELFTHTLILVAGRVFYHGTREDTVASFRDFKAELGVNHIPTNIADDILDTAALISSSGTDWPILPPHTKEAIEYQSEPVSLLKKANLVDQFGIINSRYWKLRPLAKKFSMLGIATMTAVVLGVLQRREGVDLISLSLQIKGLTVACIGMSALKNISISFDYYDDRDFYNFDSLNGLVRPTAFFLHRLIYETSMATTESLICSVLTFFILGCSPTESSATAVIALMVLYYNCIVSLYTLIYSTKLGRAEARNISFFAQALLAVTSGVWIKRGDTLVYSFMSWMESINPNYWTLSPLIRANLVGAGECIVAVSESCRITLGDLLVEQARLDDFSPNKAVQMLLLINFAFRFCQYLLLLRDSFCK